MDFCVLQWTQHIPDNKRDRFFNQKNAKKRRKSCYRALLTGEMGGSRIAGVTGGSNREYGAKT
jgi:hypothetical protein